MFRSLELHHPSRRMVAGAILLVLAVLLALAVTIDPDARRSGDAGGDDRAAAIKDGASTETMPSPIDEALVDKAAEPAEQAELDAGATADPATARDLAAIGVEADVIAPEAASPGLAPPQLDTKIVRTGSIELDVERGAFEDSWGEAQSVATAHGGYIVLASRSGAGDSSRTGSITMRVPTDRFEDALERLRRVDDATVEALDVTSQDVTQEYVDVRSRLRHDRAVERRLLALLAEAEGVSEVLAVQSRLDSVQEQIEVARGRLQYLDKLTAMSTIQVTLHAPSAANRADEDADEAGAIATAFDEARERFSENVAAAIVWVGGALPTLLLLAVLVVVGRLAWRRIDARRGEHDVPAA